MPGSLDGKTIAVVILPALFLLLYHIQDSLLYFPNMPSNARTHIQTPDKYALPFESIFLRTSDNILIHSYFIGQPDESRLSSATIVFFHGNAGNIGHRLENAKLLFFELHCNVMLVEYRGYGISNGTAHEHGLYLDGEAAVQYLVNRDDVNSKRLVLFGRSLGGAVAIGLASNPSISPQISALIVENTFTSLPLIADHVMKITYLLPRSFFTNQYQSLDRVSNIRMPTLFISGSADKLVPPSMMEKLYALSGSVNKKLLKIPGGNHDYTWRSNDYCGQIADFLKSVRINEQ